MQAINTLQKTTLVLFLFVLGSFVSSCKKDEVKPLPEPSFTTNHKGKTIKFTGTATNNATSYTWNFGDGKTATGDTITHTYDSTGTYTVTLTAANAGGSKAFTQTVEAKEELLEIKTSFGTMIMWLHNETPLHKANYLKLAYDNYFDGVTFHRIVENFVIQGGDPLSKDADPDNDGTGGPGYTIPKEIVPALKHIYGAVGAARQGDQVNPERASNGSQFYVVVNKAGTSFLNGAYTVFGQIIKGMEVADQIAVQAKDSRDRPLTNITMDVNVIEKSKAEILAEFGYTVK